jgi:hypothetical protein
MTSTRKSPQSEETHSLLDSSKSTPEAFSIITTELIEVKAMLDGFGNDLVRCRHRTLDLR